MKTVIILVLTAQCAVAQLLGSDTIVTKVLSEVTITTNAGEEGEIGPFLSGGSTTTESILERYPSLSLIRRGPYGNEPVIRGLSGGQINVTIDGMRLFGACTDKMDPATTYVESQSIKSVNARTGANASFTGANVGGSLDMKLQEARVTETPHFTRAGSAYQTAFQGWNYYASSNVSNNRAAALVSFNYRKGGNYEAANNEEIPHSQFEKLNLSVSSKLRMRTDTLALTMLLDNGWNIGFPALTMDVAYAKAGIFALTFSRPRCHGLLANTQTKIYFNTVHHAMTDELRPAGAMKMDMPGRSSTTGFFLEVQFKRFQDHRLALRLDGYSNHVKAEMMMYEGQQPRMFLQTLPESYRMVAGMFLEDNWKLSRTSQLKSTVRIDQSVTNLSEGSGRDQLKIFYPSINTSLARSVISAGSSFEKLILDAWIVCLGGTYSERLPSPGELFGYYLYNRLDGFDYIGNPNLHNERSVKLDGMVSYLRKNAKFDLSLFYNRFYDYIFSEVYHGATAMTTNASGVKRQTNIESATIFGGELSLLVSFERINIMNTTKYLYGKGEEDVPLPLIPPFENRTTVSVPASGVILSADWIGVTSQHRVNGGMGEDSTPGYNIFNTRAEYQWALKSKHKIKISGGVENILDKKYHGHLDWSNISRSGRNYIVNVDVSL
jgi:iron complex outermembrane recepter protein